MGNKKKPSTPHPKSKHKQAIKVKNGASPVPLQIVQSEQVFLSLEAKKEMLEKVTVAPTATVADAGNLEVVTTTPLEEQGDAGVAAAEMTSPELLARTLDLARSVSTVTPIIEFRTTVPMDKNDKPGGGDRQEPAQKTSVNQKVMVNASGSIPPSLPTQNPVSATVIEEVQEGREEGEITPPKEPDKPAEEEQWSNLFTGPLTAKGSKLGFVAPTITEGKPIAKLTADDFTLNSKKWMNSIIFYVIGQKPTIASVYRFISYNWNHVARPKVYMHDQGYFVICFETAKDLHEILYAGPHMFFGKPTIAKLWTPNFNLHDEVLRTVPLWVKFPNLPLNCWSVDALSRIASVLGEPLCADECTTRQLRISFARVLVDVDVTKELKHSVWVESPDGSQIEQKVIYEWTPPFCKSCNKVGHDCVTKRNTAPPKNRYQKQANDNQAWVARQNVEEKKEAEQKVPGATFVDVPTRKQAPRNRKKSPAIPITVANPTFTLADDEGWQKATKDQWILNTHLVNPANMNKFMLLQDYPEEAGECSGEGGKGEGDPIPAP